MLFLFIAAHALADFSLQGDATATCKCRKSTNPLQKAVPWYYWMASHCLTHGLFVSLVVSWCGYTRDAAIALGLAETIVHFVIDILKCEGYTSIHIDQALHILCKVVWFLLLTNAVIA